jgi:hypothetical protein
MKFHQNLSSESRVVPCGWTDERTDMTKTTVAFLNFSNAPRNIRRWSVSLQFAVPKD